MPTIYFLSGLGADERVFQFLDLSFCNPVFVPWITPIPHETLPEYALRLRHTIPDEHPFIVGVSFGGMLAVEMAKQDTQIKALIISSAKTRDELPAWIKLCRFLPLYKWLPNELMRSTVQHCNWLFGAEKRDTIMMFHSIMKQSFIPFDTWAVHAVIHWQNKQVPANVFHIHGTGDRLLPYARVRCHATIQGGRHLMVMDHAVEILPLMKNYFTLPR